MQSWKNFNDKISDQNLISQHAVTGTKFVVAGFLLNNFKFITPSRKSTDLVKLSYDESTNKMTIDMPTLPPNLFNFLTQYEAFLYTLRGCIDSFLQEVNLVYRLGIASHNVDLQEVNKEMGRKYANDCLTTHLRKLSQSDWFKYLGRLRNYYTHHALAPLITSTDFGIYLPDDPLESQLKITKNLDFFNCLEDFHSRTFAFLDEGYTYLKKYVDTP